VIFVQKQGGRGGHNINDGEGQLKDFFFVYFQMNRLDRTK
jgi:hypothetical protein